MAEIAGLVFGASAICSIFKKCFQGYEFLAKVKNLPSNAEYLSSKLIIEENRLLLLGRALGLVENEAAVERDTATGNPTFDLEQEWLQLPTTRRTVEQIFTAIELQSKTIKKLKVKYSVPEVSADEWHPIPFVRRSFSELTSNPAFSDRAMSRRASFDAWKKNTTAARRIKWAASDSDVFAKSINEFHILNNALASVIAPSLQESLSQALSSQVQRSLSLFDIRRGIPTLGVFKRAAAESNNQYLDLSIDIQQQSYALERESTAANLVATSTDTSQIPSDRIEFDESDFPASNGARERSFATFHGKSSDDLGTTRRVLVEWKLYDPKLAQEELDQLIKRVRDLVILLSKRYPQSYHLLQSFRFFDDPTSTRNQARLGIVFELPESDDRVERPRTLHELLIDPNFPKPNLGERFKLALHLAQACLQLHSSQWLHKGLRPQNVLFFPRKKKTVQKSLLDCPYLAGFEFSRIQGADHPTEHLLSADLDVCLYCHPEKLQGVRYEVTFDHYALGCLFLELALWTNLRVLFESEEVPLDLTKEEDQKRRKKHLISWASELGPEVGVIFQDVILTLLKGLDKRGQSKKDFYWDVVAQLEKCRA